VSGENVVETCRQCHPDATAEFARSYNHVAASAATNKGRRIVTGLYLGLILVVIGGMAVHNAVILNFYMVEKRRRERAERSVIRFDRIQIAQHATLALSFILLVMTGFALRYPDALWVKVTGLAFLSEPVRSWSHRVLGVALILFSVVHVFYVLASKRGREEFRAMLPSFQDIKDFGDNMAYHTWLNRKKPRFGRYDYTQKAEYWALVWGTGLMAITGLVLWFPVVATSWAPAWIVSISETIHFYEAWLAMLAIVVWHFFFVIFHPEVYPMSWIWLTGRMPEHEVESVHGRWYDEEVRDLLDEDDSAEASA
jgi:formate dehydrogenase gamma subunit